MRTFAGSPAEVGETVQFYAELTMPKQVSKEIRFLERWVRVVFWQVLASLLGLFVGLSWIGVTFSFKQNKDQLET